MKKFVRIAVFLLCFSLFNLQFAVAEETTSAETTKPVKQVEAPDAWGLAMGLRYAQIPYNTTDSSGVGDIMPLFFYKKKYFFLDGLTIGFSVPLNEKWELGAIGRLRFFDIPSDYQNEVQGTAFDYGARVRYHINESFTTDLELLIDQRGYTSANGRFRYLFESGRWDLRPWANLRWKSAGFNDTYYGLNQVSIGSGFDASLGLDAKYHLWSNIHLVGRAAITRFDKNTHKAETMASPTQFESFFGLGFFNDKDKPVSKLKEKRFVRLSHGWGAVSSLGDILAFDATRDPYDSQLTSFFYGHPLSDTLFTLPIPVYLTAGFVRHHKNDVQPNSEEYVLAVKFFYTIPLPIRLRLGFAEGLSFANPVPNMEQREMDKKEYQSSKLLNYLDISFGLNMRDIFRTDKLEDVWLGYGIHHRSGIYSNSSAFGRISGGSNYQTIYLQYHF